MNHLAQRITANSDFFYKRKDLPIIKIGDKVKVLNYLELPKSLADFGEGNTLATPALK